ncbi:MAG: hypothetical protein II839_10820, partial [Kiritimatiellae bacterium]|nr:hypothetical protein [Kiritimatiellia bacterium]
ARVRDGERERRKDEGRRTKEGGHGGGMVLMVRMVGWPFVRGDEVKDTGTPTQLQAKSGI